MFEAFENYLHDKASLTQEELAMLRAVAISKKLRKRQLLLEAGDINRHQTFVVKGCLRLYRIGPDGREHILRFATENWWMSDRESYTTGAPSESNIESLEETDVLQFTKENWEEMTNKIPAFRAFEEKILARSLAASMNRVYKTISLSTDERYEDFARTYPGIVTRVPLHMIASFLGVSRETLSRIRKQDAHR
jgi:CRP-like cAMP-binding protein